MQDVFKKISAAHASCKFWKCSENGPSDKKQGRRTGRRALKQADQSEFSDYQRKGP